ncbi:MAG: glutamate 5-kinase [Planctomycetota bacterium]|nr:glutamate 5-kinase [Planctomycetota bacterium]
MSKSSVRRDALGPVRRVVVKVGTNAVCTAGGPNPGAIRKLAQQIAALRARGVKVALVASGAIGTGMGELGLAKRPRTMPKLQAVAAIGQGQLMRAFRDVFAEVKLPVAQLLLTRDDFEDRTRYLNIRNTLAALDELGALPIINENDTVAVEEIRFGENDVLAALVCNLIPAQLLVLLTSVDGVLGEAGVLDVVERVDAGVMSLVRNERSSMGSGGMGTKLAAAALVTRAGEAAVIANAAEPGVLERILAGETVGTLFVPARRKMSSRRRWIGQASRTAGKVYVDAGAARALRQRGKSLLPSGVTAVAGSFAKGDTVAVIDPDGMEIARGLTNYAADQVEKIMGLKTEQIAQALGDKPYDEVIHRNNMTLV